MSDSKRPKPKHVDQPADDQPDAADALCEAYRAGKYLVRQLSVFLRQYPIGTYVLIDAQTLQFVTGNSLTETINLFRQKFPEAEGFVHRIGEPN